MFDRVRFFAESYRLCVPELKSVGWQCAILGQLAMKNEAIHDNEDEGDSTEEEGS